MSKITVYPFLAEISLENLSMWERVFIHHAGRHIRVQISKEPELYQTLFEIEVLNHNSDTSKLEVEGVALETELASLFKVGCPYTLVFDTEKTRLGIINFVAFGAAVQR